ncbi:MAG: heterodisulfide reductase-related iron-sulfur binding cluster [Bacillota bacterium]|nr:heterodisulfide reductase-related iron-sulfur binding cluster [Bacillota bacterium]
MDQYLKQFKTCVEREIPFCMSACPFHVDVKDFIEKLRRGGFDAAFKVFRNACGFPGIVAALCPAPCQEACPVGEKNLPVRLPLLERACLDHAANQKSTSYNVPAKNKKCAVIGAGPSGLACALRLCMKKYDVTIYEKSGRIGGHLWELLPPEVFLEDIESQFGQEKYTLRLNTEIKTPEELMAEGYTAVYVATGEGGRDLGLLGEKDHRCRREDTAFFAGGSLVGKGAIEAIADGLNTATVMDVFAMVKNLQYPLEREATKMVLGPRRLLGAEDAAAPEPSQEGRFTKEEAKAEALRCVECQCDACQVYCDLLSFYKKWPMRVRDEVFATIAPGEADLKATPAKKLISTCSQCGLCKVTCPKEIDLGGYLLEARKSMHRQGKMAWVFNDFWLRDMAFADGEYACVARTPRGAEKSRYVFFPGCQLGAADPQYVLKPYRWLLEKQPDTAILTGCCGAPAEWAGDEEKHRASVEKIRETWEAFGKPVFILACPTCGKMFRKHLPDIPSVFLYSLMEEWGLEAARKGEGAGYEVFDPCASREEPALQDTVRRLAAGAGYELRELPDRKEHPRCCSWGGQPSIANARYAETVVQKRIQEGEQPYLAYCVNCRDIFLEAGKPTVHLLDLFFDVNDTGSRPPTITERRRNRVDLKEALLREFWGEKMERKPEPCGLLLKISPELQKKLDKEHVLEDEICQVIKFCEEKNRRIYDPETGHYTGYKQIGNMTCWAEYVPLEEGYELINAYTHRMKIDMEAVWNGRKTDPDLL